MVIAPFILFFHFLPGEPHSLKANTRYEFFYCVVGIEI